MCSLMKFFHGNPLSEREFWNSMSVQGDQTQLREPPNLKLNNRLLHARMRATNHITMHTASKNNSRAAKFSEESNMIWNTFGTTYTDKTWDSLGIGRVKNAKHQLNHHAIEVQASPEEVLIQQTSICTSLAPHQFLQNMHTKTNPGQDSIQESEVSPS